MTIYDGATDASPVVGKYCQSYPPPSFISSTNAAFLNFQSDDITPRPGFKLEYHPSEPGKSGLEKAVFLFDLEFFFYLEIEKIL